MTVLPTLLSFDRLANLIKYSNMGYSLEGDVAEFGVFQGGSLELLAQHNAHKTVWGIDSFQGLPEVTAKDNFHKKGDFNEINFNDLKGYFSIMYRNVELVKGFSPDVFFGLHPHKKYSLVHIDVDLYQSVKDGLDYFYPRMVDGGVIILDDYGWESTEGAKIAVDEFVSYLVKEAKENESISPRFCSELKYFPGGPSHKQFIIIR